MALVRLPPLIDVHAHLRDFNQRHKGTFETETLAALAGGFGTVLVMPNTDPPILTRSQIVRIRYEIEHRVRRRTGIYCDVGFFIGTNGQSVAFEGAVDIARGLKIYLSSTTGNLWLQDPISLTRAFANWPKRNWLPRRPILFHVEEDDNLKTVLDLSREFKKPVHICHVARAEQVEIIREAKRRRISVTAETCPHYLAFTKSDLRTLGSYGLMKPALGTAQDREALWGGIRDRTIDVIATDHAPHSQEEKASENPPFGVIGEPAFPIIWALLHERGFTLEDLTRLMYRNPARIFGIKRDRRSYMRVAVNEEFVFERSMIHSKAGHSPYEGMQVRGRIIDAYLHGTQVICQGEILQDVRAGRVI